MILPKIILPVKPYATNDLKLGIYKLPRKKAILNKYIQLNEDGPIRFIIYDIDMDNASLAYLDNNCPIPNIITSNPKTGHAHYIYILKIPVHNYSKSRKKPIEYLKKIQYSLGVQLGADPDYVGLLTRNPYHPDHKVICPRKDPYSLEELTCGVDLVEKTKKNFISVEGQGRNCTLFDQVRFWAYREEKPISYQNWYSSVLRKATELNTFEIPLNSNEIKDIAKSVAKYVWKNGAPKRDSEPSSTGLKIRQDKAEFNKNLALEMQKSGVVLGEIPKKLQVTRMTLYRWGLRSLAKRDVDKGMHVLYNIPDIEKRLFHVDLEFRDRSASIARALSLLRCSIIFPLPLEVPIRHFQGFTKNLRQDKIWIYSRNTKQAGLQEKMFLIDYG